MDNSNLKKLIDNRDIEVIQEYVKEKKFPLEYCKEISNNPKYSRPDSIIKFIISQLKNDLNLIIPLISLLSDDDFKTSNILIKNGIDINQKIDNTNVIEFLFNDNKLNKKNLIYILKQGYSYTGISNELISKIIISRQNNNLLKIILNFFSLNNSYVLAFLLNGYKNKKGLSNNEILNLMGREKSQINITEKMYESAIISQNFEAIKILFIYDNNDDDEILCRINGYDLLDKAVRTKDSKFVKIILQYDSFNLNSITSGNMIVEAIKNNNIDILDLLIKSSLNSYLYAKNKVSYLNLFINTAIEIKSFEFLKYIMEKSAIKDIIDINTKDIYDKYPIVTAIYACNLDIFKYLLNNGVNINVKNSEGKSLLSLAIDTFPIAIKYLLKRPNVKINEKDVNGDYPVIKAIYRNNFNITVLLYKYAQDNNIEMNIKDQSGNTPLLISYRLNYQKIFRYLLMYCDINERDGTGNTLLFYSILNKHIGTIKYLVNHGADVNFVDALGNTLFDIAKSTGSKDSLIALIQSKNLLINKPNLNGDIPLCSIINDNNYNIESKEIIVCELVKKGSNVNFIDIRGNTPLVYAIRQKLLNIAKFLIENGSNVNHITYDNKSIMMEAIENDELPIVKYLIKFGADINYCSPTGETAFSMASKKESGNQIIFEYLTNYNVNNCPPNLVDDLIRNNNQNLLTIIKDNHPPAHIAKKMRFMK